MSTLLPLYSFETFHDSSSFCDSNIPYHLFHTLLFFDRYHDHDNRLYHRTYSSYSFCFCEILYYSLYFIINSTSTFQRTWSQVQDPHHQISEGSEEEGREERKEKRRREEMKNKRKSEDRRRVKKGYEKSKTRQK